MFFGSLGRKKRQKAQNKETTMSGDFTSAGTHDIVL